MRSAVELKAIIVERMERHVKDLVAYEAYIEDWKKRSHGKGAKPRPRRITSFLVEYIYKGKAKMKEYRYL